MDQNYTVTLSASEPKYYQFMFPEGVSNVLLTLTSDDSACMSVSIQNLTVFPYLTLAAYSYRLNIFWEFHSALYLTRTMT